MPSPDNKEKRKQMGMPSARTSALPQALVQEKFMPANITPETAGQERGGLSYQGKAYQANISTTWKDINESLKVGIKGIEVFKKIKTKAAQDEREELEEKLLDTERAGEVPATENTIEDVLDENGDPVLDVDGLSC